MSKLKFNTSSSISSVKPIPIKNSFGGLSAQERMAAAFGFGMKKNQMQAQATQGVIAPGSSVSKVQDKTTGATYLPPDAARFTPQSMNNLETMKEALSSLDAVEQLASQIHGGRIKGTTQTLKSEISGGEGGDATVKLYNDSVKSNALTIFRAMHPGVKVTNYDAQHIAQPLFWQVNESDDLKKPKFETIRKQIMSNISQLSGKPDISPSPSPIPGMNQSGAQSSTQDNDPLGLFK